jgi:PAS domain S-box-containing protein
VDYYEIKKERGELISRILSEGYVNDYVVKLRRKDGTVFLCSITCRAVFDADGILVFIDGILRDVTGDKSIYQKAHLDNISDNLNDFMVIMDLRGLILDINKAGADLLGRTKNFIIGTPLSDYLTTGSEDRLKEFINDVMQTGRQEAVFTLRDSDGRERFLELSAFLVKRENNAHHIKGIGRDVTQRVLKRKEEMRQEKLEGIMEMAGEVAHRMNQPLTIINNLLMDLLSIVPKDDPVYKKIEKISKQIQVLNDISKKIKGISRYSSVDYVRGIKIVDIDNASE